MLRRNAPAPLLFVPVLVLVLLALLAPPASAELYTVSLNNGASFDTLYRPEVASWDEGMMMILTDVGNWIAISRDEVASITEESEVRGFGVVISTNTIALGWAPNDAPLPGEEVGLDPQERLLNLLERQSAPRENYTVPQFAEPSASGGIPIWMSNTNTPPLGGGASSRGLSAGEPPQSDRPPQR